MVLHSETKIEMKEVISVAFEGAKINSLAVFGTLGDQKVSHKIIFFRWRCIFSPFDSHKVVFMEKKFSNFLGNVLFSLGVNRLSCLRIVAFL